MHTKHQIGKIIFFIITGDRKGKEERKGDRKGRLCVWVLTDEWSEGQQWRAEEPSTEAHLKSKTITATGEAEHEVRSRREVDARRKRKRKKSWLLAHWSDGDACCLCDFFKVETRKSW